MEKVTVIFRAGEDEVERLRGCPYSCERCGGPLPGLVVWPYHCLPECNPDGPRRVPLDWSEWDEMVVRSKMSPAEIREDTFRRSEARGRAAVIVCRERVRRYLGWPAIKALVS